MSASCSIFAAKAIESIGLPSAPFGVRAPHEEARAGVFDLAPD